MSLRNAKGHFVKGFKHSEKAIEKIRRKLKGRMPWNTGKECKILSEKAKEKWNNPDYRKKMSKVHKGYKHSEETKRKISESNKGKKHTEETKRKMREVKKGKGNGLTGKKHSKETRKKMSEVRKGSKSHFWKGGINSINDTIRKGIEYRLWRSDVFERDKYLCQMPDCDKTERYLNAHHIKKFADYPELRFDISNGITLCKKCHNKIRRQEEKYEELFTNIINCKL